MTTEDVRNKQRRGGTEAPSSQDARPVLDLEAIREIVAHEIRVALDPIVDQIVTLTTEIRKTRIALDRGSQFTEDAVDEEWLEEGVGRQSQVSSIYSVQPRGRSGRTQFRAGLPVKEPEMLEIPLWPQKEGK